MGRRTDAAVWGAVLLAAALVGLGGGARPAVADQPVTELGAPVPLVGVDAMVVDAVHGREFVEGSNTPGEPRVVVLSSSGSVLKTIALPDADSMVLSPDAGTVYVALNRAHAIAAIDTTTLAVRTFDTGPDSCPRTLAVTAGVVWHSDFCVDISASEDLGALDPVTGGNHQGLAVDDSAGALASSPRRPGQLWYCNEHDLKRLAVTGGPSPQARVVAHTTLTRGSELYPSRDGTRLLVPTSLTTVVLDSRTLQPVDSYPWRTTGEPAHQTALAVGPGGMVAQAIFASTSRVVVRPPGQTVGGHVYSFPLRDYPLTQIGVAGLGFGAGGLYVLTDSGDDAPGVRLHLLQVIGRGLIPDSWKGQRRLPLLGPTHILADPRHGRVFVADDTLGNGIVATDTRGRIVKVFQHLPRPDAMTLSADHNTLYVATAGSTSIAAIDTRTLRVRRLPLGTDTCPTSAAPAAGLVWFTADCGTGSTFAALNPATGRVYRHPDRQQPRAVSTFAGLRPAPTPHPVLLGTSGDKARITVAGLPHPTAWITHAARTGPYAALLHAETVATAIAPDGLTMASLLYSFNGSGTMLTQATRNLALTGAFPGSAVKALAIRGDGLTASAGLGRTLYLSTQPTSPDITRRQVPGAYWIVDGFSFGHRRLYSLNHNLTYGWYVGGYPMPPVRPLALTQETPVHIAGQRVRVAAHVDGWGTAARRTVNLYARPHGARRGHLVARARTDRYGNARFAPRLTVSTRLTTVAPAVGHRHRLLGRLTIRPGVRLRDNVHDLAGQTSSNDIMPPGARPAFDVQVSPTHAGQCLFIQLDRGDGDNHWTPVYRGCFQIGTHGRVRYVLPAGLQGLVRIRAVFKGDARNAPTSTLWRTIVYQ